MQAHKVDEILEYEIVVSDAALSMLDNHVAFLTRVSINAATRLMDTILDDMSSLSTFPERFPYYDNKFITENRYRRMLSAKRYLIIYEVNNEIPNPTVFVDYIVDCRSDYDLIVE